MRSGNDWTPSTPGLRMFHGMAGSSTEVCGPVAGPKVRHVGRSLKCNFKKFPPHAFEAVSPFPK
jgi:hypothetical protein